MKIGALLTVWFIVGYASGSSWRYWPSDSASAVRYAIAFLMGGAAWAVSMRLRR